MLLNNRFQILEQLGRGGFGETFLTEDTHMPSRRRCVVKQFKPNLENQQSYAVALEQFKREATVLEQLGESHDQIPRLHGSFEEEGQFYLVQEWIEGQTLSEKVLAEGALPEETVQQLLHDLLPVLDYIHSNKIVHRDIKPENIILRDRDQKPVLIDFGSVKQTLTTVVAQTSGIPCSVAIGSGGFMAPEQVARRIVYSSDLYSLGMTAIFLLTGQLPENLENDPRTSQPLWQQYAPGVSSHLAAVIDSAIQFSPRDRYTTASEMLQALDAPGTSTDSALHTPPPPSHRSQPTRVSPVPAGIANPVPDAMPAAMSSTNQSTPTRVSAVGARPTAVVRNNPVRNNLVRNNLEPAAANATPTANLPDRGQRRSWTMVGTVAGLFAVALAAGAIGSYAYSQWQANQDDRVVWKDIEALHDQQKFDQCQQQAKEFSGTSGYFKKVQNLLNQCRLQAAKQLTDRGQYQEAIVKAEEIPADADDGEAAQKLVGDLVALRTADRLAAQGQYKTAIAQTMKIPPDSEVAATARNKIAKWSHVPLKDSMNRNPKLKSGIKRDRNALINASSIQTQFGSSLINPAPEKGWPAEQQPSAKDKTNPSWDDPWQETYTLVKDEMHLGVVYGCITKEILQTEVTFAASVDLPLMQTKLNQMLENGATETIQQKLAQVYKAKKATNHSFQTNKFRGWIQRDAKNQIRIAIREA